MASNIVFTAEKTEISEQESFSVRRTGWNSWDASLPWETLSDCIMTLTNAFAAAQGTTTRGLVYQVRNVAGNYRPVSTLQWLDTDGSEYLLSIHYDELPLLASALTDLAAETGEALDLDFSKLTRIKPGNRFDYQLADAVKDEDTEFSEAVAASVVEGISGLASDVTDLETLTDSGRLGEESVAANIRGVFGRVIDTDYASLTLALAATPVGGTLEVRGQYTRNTPFVVNKEGVTIEWLGGKITNTATAQDIVHVTASNVTLKAPKLVGAGMSVFGAGKGIRAFGTLATPLTDIKILDPDIQEVSHTAIELRLCGRSSVMGGSIRNCGYSGVTYLSVTNSCVSGVNIRDITQPAGYVNSYGVAVTNYDATEPPSSDVLVSGNFVSNVPWEGCDSHGGLRVTFDRNSIINCGSSVSIVGGPNNVAARECVVSFNKCFTATRASAIIFVGPGSGTDRATGSIIGNEVLNASADGTNNAGIQAYYTKGLVIANNVLKECSVNGINAQNNNEKVVITGNTVTDVWSELVLTSAIFIGATGNTSTVANNSLDRGTKVATRVNEHGLRTGSSSPALSVVLGVNDFALATTPILDSSNATFSFGGAKQQILGLSGGTLGFFGATPVAKPTAYTQTYSTASKTHAAYTPNDKSAAFSSTPAALTDAATLADLNALRVAVENLRLHHQSTAGVVNSVIDDLQATGLVG